jgi:integrase
MNETHYRDGNVVLFKRTDSKNYQARIKLDNGKWKRFGTGSEDIKEANSIACEKFDEIKVLSKRNIAIDTRRFKDVAKLAISEMEKELESGYGKKSFVDYIQALNNYFIPYFNNTHINTIDYKKLKEFDEWRIDKAGRELKHSTINNHNSALQRVFKVAVDRSWINSVQIPVLKNTGEKGKRRPYFTQDEYLKLYRHMRTWCNETSRKKSLEMRELLRDYVLILANTGIRPGTETNNLKWKHIEEFEQQGMKFIRFWVSGKTGERELIARHNVRRYLNRIQSRFEVCNSNDYVFRLRSGTRTYSMNATFEECLKNGGLLEDRHGAIRTFYSLRHTYATFQVLNGVDYHTLAKNMGTSIGMLEKHYSHLTPTLAANQLAGKRHPDRTSSDLKKSESPGGAKKKKVK